MLRNGVYGLIRASFTASQGIYGAPRAFGRPGRREASLMRVNQTGQSCRRRSRT